MVNKISSLEALERVKTMSNPPTAYSSSNNGIAWFFEDIELIRKDLEVLEIIKEHCYVDSNGVFKNINTVELSWDDYDLVKQVLNNKPKKEKEELENER